MIQVRDNSDNMQVYHY